MPNFRLDEIDIFEKSMVFSEDAPLDGYMHHVETVNLNDDEAIDLLKEKKVKSVKLRWVDNVSQSRKNEVKQKLESAGLEVRNT